MIIKKDYPKLLYLDQNHMINLAKIHYGIQKDNKVSELLNTIRNLVQSGKLKVATNFTNSVETSKVMNPDRRQRYTEFMLSITKCITFPPYVYIFEPEILNYVLRCRGKKEFNLRESIVTVGLLLGQPTIISDTIDKETLKKMNKLSQLIVSTPQMIEFSFNKYREIDPKTKSEYVNEIKAIQENVFKIKDKKLRKMAQNLHYLKTYFLPKFIEILIKNKINPLKNIPNLRNENEIEQFLIEFPMAYCNHCLDCGRISEKSREPKYNDLWDITGLAFPIAYFDYVVSEKYFMTVAKRYKLDELYETTLLNKLSDLKKYLEHC